MLELRCVQCARKLGEVNGSDFALKIVCRRCKRENRYSQAPPSGKD